MVYANQGGTLPSEWVGWVVDRETLGDCSDPVDQIGGVIPFPTGTQSYQLAAASATIRIFGKIDAEFEGPYISEVTTWSLSPGCSPVVNQATNWGGLKARYR